MKILAFPKDTNPYQELLYREMRMTGVEVDYLVGKTNSQSLNLVLLPVQVLINRLKGYRIFHLHWVYTLQAPLPGQLGKMISTVYYYFFLTFVKIVGFKLVWTVHNILPHRQTFLNDLRERKFLAKIADRKILHSEKTIFEMQRIGIDTEKCLVIPIGSYKDIYKTSLTKEECRLKHNLKSDDFVFLFFGKIEKYKGVINLLSVFSKLNIRNAKLVVAGKCDSDEIKRSLAVYRKDKNITVIDRHVSDLEFAELLKMSDAVVLPFEKVTTSSTLILAVSEGLPVICPRLSGLEKIDSNLIHFYEPGNNEQMSELLKSKNDLKSEATVISRLPNWKKVGKMTSSVFNSLIS